MKKISEMTAKDIASYLRLDETSEEEKQQLEQLLEIAKAFIKNFTGKNNEDADSIEEFVIVVYVLCQDMWDNRRLYVDGENLNYLVESILGMYSVNLL